MLLRQDGELVAVDADGLFLACVDGPYARVSGALARFPGIPGHHRLLDAEGATQSLTPLAVASRLVAGGELGQAGLQ